MLFQVTNMRLQLLNITEIGHTINCTVININNEILNNPYDVCRYFTTSRACEKEERERERERKTAR